MASVDLYFISEFISWEHVEPGYGEVYNILTALVISFDGYVYVRFCSLMKLVSTCSCLSWSSAHRLAARMEDRSNLPSQAPYSIVVSFVVRQRAQNGLCMTSSAGFDTGGNTQRNEFIHSPGYTTIIGTHCQR